MTTTYTTRYRRLAEQRAVVREQAAYRVRVAEFGLSALLAPVHGAAVGADSVAADG